MTGKEIALGNLFEHLDAESQYFRSDDETSAEQLSELLYTFHRVRKYLQWYADHSPNN